MQQLEEMIVRNLATNSEIWRNLTWQWENLAWKKYGKTMWKIWHPLKKRGLDGKTLAKSWENHKQTAKNGGLNRKKTYLWMGYVPFYVRLPEVKEIWVQTMHSTFFANDLIWNTKHTPRGMSNLGIGQYSICQYWAANSHQKLVDRVEVGDTFHQPLLFAVFD